MTIGHELGHHTMHYKIKNSIFKMPSSGKFKSNCYSPEWQAKCFAGELLMPYEIIKDLTLEETIQKCGVSREAAEYQRKIYNL